jgi:hypothetical protein
VVVIETVKKLGTANTIKRRGWKLCNNVALAGEHLRKHFEKKSLPDCEEKLEGKS